MRKILIAILLVAISCGRMTEVTVTEGENGKKMFHGKESADFILAGEAFLEDNAKASITFHSAGEAGSGYEVLFHNGPIDGTPKTGSLTSVRNLYRSLAEDGEWFPFEIAVRGKNIAVRIKGTDVVCYTEPEEPYRNERHALQRLGSGHFEARGYAGTARFRNLKVKSLKGNVANPGDTLPPVNEQTDHIIRLQQEDFPVIDWHIHAKGGLTMEMAHALSMNYGINYGVGPNAYGPMKPGEGGYGTMYTGDEDLGEYFESVKDLPFLRGVQGEGRKWSYSFSDSVLSKFDYLYTDAMTIFDHKGRLTRIYRPEEVIMDIPKERYMEMLVDQTVKILTEEPADILANAFFLPDVLASESEKYWTDSRVDRVLNVLKENGIALEISARYKIPSERIIRRAREMGIKFTFGTNNMGTGYGRLEYCAEMIKVCGLTPEDMWYPTMSTRSARYNSLLAADFLAAYGVNEKVHGEPLNVIYILADDMGYADLSCTGQKRFETPNIDRLAKQGMLFTHHYAGFPVSAPSRSCLMTGLNAGHTPIRGNKEIEPEGQEPLPAGTYTLGRMFKENGYATGAFGKWGLGFPGSEGAPEKMGFDRFFGYNCQRQSHRYYPEHLWSDSVRFEIPENKAGACRKYAPDIIQDEALKFIRENGRHPFFAYLAYTLPHAELISPDDSLLQRYRGRYKERPFKGIDYAEVTEPAGYASNDEPYAAFASMMVRLDAYVGQVVALVDSLGLAERTLIVFTSDNGPHREGGANPDYFLSYGPFRGVKRDLYEGGIRLPMIARLPGTIAAGSVSKEMATMFDMMPTFAEVAGAELSVATDGISVWPAMTGDTARQEHHDVLYWEFHENGGTLAVREGDWKVIAFGLNGRFEHLGETDFRGLRYELYNTAWDIHEDRDLASRYPEKVRHLLEIARKTHVRNEIFPF